MNTHNYVNTSVLTAATNFNLATLDDVKADLNIVTDDEDDYLQRLISQASAAIANYCNRVFPMQLYQDNYRPERDARPYFISNHVNPIMLAKPTLISVASVNEIDGLGNNTALVADTDYEIDYDTARLYRLDGNLNPRNWPSWRIVVVYSAGWVLPGDTPAFYPAGPALPSDIEDATIRTVKARRFARTRDPDLLSDTVAGIGAQTYWTGNESTRLPMDVMDLLDGAYRIRAKP